MKSGIEPAIGIRSSASTTTNQREGHGDRDDQCVGPDASPWRSRRGTAAWSTDDPSCRARAREMMAAPARTIASIVMLLMIPMTL